MLIVDAHQDLAWNILTFGRDYTRSVQETRSIELGTDTPVRNGDTLLGWAEYQEGRVAIIFATLFAAPIRRKVGDLEKLVYTTQAQARTLYRSQLDVYSRLVEEQPDKFKLVRGRETLELTINHWRQYSKPEHPIGLVLLMEGAECIGDLAELEEWWEWGLRLIGPAWAGTRFCGGTREPGPLTSEGYDLLESMADFGFILDISHMDDTAALQALDFFPGTVVATHANARALLPGTESNRNLSDRVLHSILERDGVVGIVPSNTFLLAGWQRGDQRSLVSIQHVVSQIDYVCQMAGDAKHTGLGSDFDGGFGLQSVPADIDSIADLRKLIPLLSEKGYTEEDIAAVLGENWISLLRRSLPDT